MRCICRNCGVEYDSLKARGDWAGFCSAKCQHAKAKELGCKKPTNAHRPGAVAQSEYVVLKAARCIGDVPTDDEKVKLRKELEELQNALYGSPRRIETIQRLLVAKL
jgi:hypothetical protein